MSLKNDIIINEFLRFWRCGKQQKRQVWSRLGRIQAVFISDITLNAKNFRSFLIWRLSQSITPSPGFEKGSSVISVFCLYFSFWYLPWTLLQKGSTWQKCVDEGVFLCVVVAERGSAGHETAPEALSRLHDPDLELPGPSLSLPALSEGDGHDIANPSAWRPPHASPFVATSSVCGYFAPLLDLFVI